MSGFFDGLIKILVWIVVLALCIGLGVWHAGAVAAGWCAVRVSRVTGCWKWK